MRRSSTAAGKRGEQIAERYLTDHGYTIIARNWRGKRSRHEIDLIVRDGETLVFVEVKSARTRAFGDPATWIGPRKQRAIIAAARDYLSQIPADSGSVRFDAILIEPAGADGQRAVRHVKAAFVEEEEDSAKEM